MALLPIRIYGDPVLRKKSESVAQITPEIKKIVRDMTEIMEKNDGIGLAAPQVGISKSIITMETKDGPLGFINPRVLKESQEKIITEEGCLSFPGLFLKIKRPKSVEVESWVLNREKRLVKVKTSGLLARILLHELDHLNGVLFIDRISFIQRLKIRRTLKKIKSFRGSYR